MSQQRPAKGGSGLDVRAAAARSLVPVLTDKGSLASLDEHSVVARDRGLLKELCYGTCRWFYRLDGELNSRLKKPLRKPDRIIHHLMLVALFQLRFSQQANYAVLNETVEACRALDKPHLTGLVNGVLRAAEREGAQ